MYAAPDGSASAALDAMTPVEVDLAGEEVAAAGDALNALVSAGERQGPRRGTFPDLQQEGEIRCLDPQHGPDCERCASRRGAAVRGAAGRGGAGV